MKTAWHFVLVLCTLIIISTSLKGAEGTAQANGSILRDAQVLGGAGRIESVIPAEAGEIDPAWGTTAHVLMMIQALSFQASDSITEYTYSGTNSERYSTSAAGSGCFDANLDLPSGAHITGLVVEACDTNNTESTDWGILQSPSPAGGFIVHGFGNTGAVATPGCAVFGTADNLAANNLFVDKLANGYYARVCLGAADATTTFRTVRIFYKLRISPAPATATFSDVPPSHPFYQFIEALAASGITAGCTAPPNPTYCPDATLTRGQMAVFLARALGLHWSP